MSDYIKVFEGFLNDNAEGVAKNEKAPRYRSGGGKNAIKVERDIPAGTVLYLGAWGGKSQFGPYIRVTAQMKTEEQPKAAPKVKEFDDEIPF